MISRKMMTKKIVQKLRMRKNGFKKDHLQAFSQRELFSVSCRLRLKVINASAAVTLLRQRPEKNSGSERDSNPRPLRCQCSALPGLCLSSVTAALALMTVGTQLLLMDKINFHPTILGPSITSTFKGLTRIRPLSCGFDSSVGRALHWHRRGRGFESRSEPEFFSGLCLSSVTAALALMTVSTESNVDNYS